MTNRALALAVAAVCGVSVGSTASDAAPVTLQDKNTIVNFNLTDPGTRGMVDWFVDGTDHLQQQWFWVRVNGVDTREYRVDSAPPFGAPVHLAQDTDGDGFNDFLRITYLRASVMEVTIKYTLTGGELGSGWSDMGESITIKNKTSQPLSVSFFQYTDLDLMGTPFDDTTQIVGGNTAQVLDALGVRASETVVTPFPASVEVAAVPVTLTALEDNLVTNLSGGPGPLGPGNTSWAFQWNFTIPANQSVIISKDKQIVPIPEPSAVAVCLLGLGLFAARRRR